MEKENCFGIVEYPITLSVLEKRTKKEFKDSKNNIKKFFIELGLGLLYSIVYCKCFSKLSISETVSYINEVSFPFNELLIIVTGNYDVNARIKYHNDTYTETIFLENKKTINITSELKASNIILNKEFESYLSILFKIKENKEQSKNEDGEIMINWN